MIEKATKLLVRILSNISSECLKSNQHPHRQWFFDGPEIRSPFKGLSDEAEPYNVPRQALPDYYFQTGDLEMVRRDTLLSGSVSGEHTLGLIIDETDYIDIDTMGDLESARQKIEKEDG